MFSEPENPMFPQLTDSHRLLSGSGLFRFMLWPWRVEKEIQETSCSKCHRDPQSKDNMETLHLFRQEPDGPESRGAAATAGSQGASRRRGLVALGRYTSWNPHQQSCRTQSTLGLHGLPHPHPHFLNTYYAQALC